jgi:hypothetical protein
MIRVRVIVVALVLAAAVAAQAGIVASEGTFEQGAVLVLFGEDLAAAGVARVVAGDKPDLASCTLAVEQSVLAADDTRMEIEAATAGFAAGATAYLHLIGEDGEPVPPSLEVLVAAGDAPGAPGPPQAPGPPGKPTIDGR